MLLWFTIGVSLLPSKKKNKNWKCCICYTFLITNSLSRSPTTMNNQITDSHWWTDFSFLRSVSPALFFALVSPANFKLVRCLILSLVYSIFTQNFSANSAIFVSSSKTRISALKQFCTVWSRLPIICQSFFPLILFWCVDHIYVGGCSRSWTGWGTLSVVLQSMNCNFRIVGLDCQTPGTP